MSFLDGKNYFVLGLGLSGRAAAALLADDERNVTVYDENAAVMEKYAADIEKEPYRDRVDVLSAAGSDAVFERISDCDSLVLSPGVPLDHPAVSAARKNNVAVVSEIEAAYHYTRADIVGVTGTNGKSTTVGVIGSILEAAGLRCVVAGNVGTPFASVVGRGRVYDVIVLELSSFQLDTIFEFKANVSLLLNVTPDHLDRYHNSMDEYANSKSRILNLADENSCFIYNDDDKYCRAFSEGYPGTAVPFNSSHKPDGPSSVYFENGAIQRRWLGVREAVLPAADFTPVGVHNLENAMAAIGAASAMSVSLPDIRGGLRSYRPLPHRMELVRVVDGVSYINDSKATNVDATIKSLISVDGGVVLILGGRDKEGDFGSLRPHLGNVKKIILVGESADKIRAALEQSCEIETQADMDSAVRAATACTQTGDTVLLAPACASFDMFESYKHRGEVFRSCVNTL
jgi:UDP-N-acetylmuramoylalanine--D-glutamate ligase